MAFQPASVEGSRDVPFVDSDIKGPDHPILSDGSKPNFETYLYHAQRQREREVAESKSRDMETGFWAKILFGNHTERQLVAAANNEKKGDDGASISDAEYRAASGALRTASWGGVFYLITTGPWFYFLGPFPRLIRFRYPGTLLDAMGILPGWLWPRHCMLRRIRRHGCL